MRVGRVAIDQDDVSQRVRFSSKISFGGSGLGILFAIFTSSKGSSISDKGGACSLQLTSSYITAHELRKKRSVIAARYIYPIAVELFSEIR